MNVAVPDAKHSPRFGQRASSQTVDNPRARINLRTSSAPALVCGCIFSRKAAGNRKGAFNVDGIARSDPEVSVYAPARGATLGVVDLAARARRAREVLLLRLCRPARRVRRLPL